MKKIILFALLALTVAGASAQDPTARKNQKKDKRAEAKKRQATIARQQEEGVLVFSKQTAGGVQLRTNGYGAFLELGRWRSPRFANIYSIEITEIKSLKEEKASGDNFFSNSFVYGKINNFYQLKLGFGQQYVFGQKGNKNGIAVLGVAHGGLSAGLLKPYYVRDQGGNDIKYESADSARFLTPAEISGGSGFGKGWGELKVRPGVYFKTALRFDFNRFNESISALEVGASIDYYFSKIPLIAFSEPKSLFFQAHIAYVFGRRK